MALTAFTLEDLSRLTSIASLPTRPIHIDQIEQSRARLMMEESKDLQAIYKIFRTFVYVSLVLEFFEYAVNPEAFRLLGWYCC
jgi:hypothetical protein